MKFADIRFPDVEGVKAIHERVLVRHGGQAGVRDEGLLSSAVTMIQSGYYGSLAELAASLCFSLAKNHPFLDGNKRTAVTSAAAFLAMNGHRVTLPADEWETIVLAVASGAMGRDELTQKFAAVMGEPVHLQ